MFHYLDKGLWKGPATTIILPALAFQSMSSDWNDLLLAQHLEKESARLFTMATLLLLISEVEQSRTDWQSRQGGEDLPNFWNHNIII